MRKTQRSSDEIIVLALCALCMLGLALFSLFRLQRDEFEVALLDGLGFFAASIVLVYVYRTHKVKWAGIVLGLGSLFGTVALVALEGAEERYLLYPTIVVVFFLMKPKYALLAALSAVVSVSYFVFPVLEPFMFGKFLLSLTGSFLFAYVFASERNQQRDELLSLSTVDPLTGVGNRRAFDQYIDAILRIRERTPVSASVLLMDLDNFKLVNDSRGHDAGDEVLREIAEIIDGRMRAGDEPYRYGGDEFAVIARGEGVNVLANDLCERISAYAATAGLPISISIGKAELTAEESAAQWIKRSDDALYRAKSLGKNQVCFAEDD